VTARRTARPEARRGLVIRDALSTAVRSVNAAYNRLSSPAQESIEIAHDDYEAEMNTAIVAGDRERAEVAIHVWREHWLETFKEAIR
jgi:hypothetical protein